MKKIDFNVMSEDEALNLILQCEENFNRHINEAVDKIVGESETKIITLAGPTCSGKTTTAGMLTKRIEEDGKNAVVMSIDDFYIDRKGERCVTKEVPDYDSIKSIDFDYFAMFTKRLAEGKSVLIPNYDFTVTRRVGYEEYIPKKNDIYVFEGIQAVYPEITELFCGANKSIFISVTDDIIYNGTVLTKNEIRLLRRIVRDYKFRNSSAEFTLHLWKSVRDNEDANIFPNSENCSIYLNSFMEYEPFIISSFVRPLLLDVPEGSKYSHEAKDLLCKMKAFECPLFSDRMVPENSVFREFIGK